MRVLIVVYRIRLDMGFTVPVVADIGTVSSGMMIMMLIVKIIDLNQTE